MLVRVLEEEVMDTPEEAAAYDAMDHSEPNAAFVERLAALGAHGRMLDLGTGPGHIPLMVADRWPQAEVVAVDAARSMLELAVEKLAGTQHADRIRFEHADVKNVSYGDFTFDCVFSNTVLHHLADPVAMLREAWRVLRPGGVLMIRDLFRPEDKATLRALVAQHAGQATPCQRGLFEASLRAALTPSELQQLADQVGIQPAEVLVDSDRHMTLQSHGKGGERA